MATNKRRPALTRMARELDTLYQDALSSEKQCSKLLRRISPAWRGSAHNLVHYLTVRRHDIRTLQRDLSHSGLSSLGRMESHVLASLDAVREALASAGDPPALPGPCVPI